MGATCQTMQRAIAALLLACLGMMFPVAGSSVRLCLMDQKLLVPGISECSRDEARLPSCCKDSAKKEHRKDSPCCLAFKKLPEAQATAFPAALPAAVAIDLPEPIFIVPPVILVSGPVFSASEPIRGPDTPALRRAMLEVWRL